MSLVHCADVGLIVLSSNFLIFMLFDVCPLVEMLFFILYNCL